MRSLVLLSLLVSIPLAAQEPPVALPAELTTRLGEMLEQDWENRPQWGEMAVTILKGGPMGSGKGWYTPSLRKHDWSWLEKTFPDATGDKQIERDEIAELTDDLFAVLDRDRDKTITPDDFQFAKNPLMEDDSPAGGIFSLLDDDSNGRVTRDELQRWFDKSADGSDFLAFDEFKDALGLESRPQQQASKKEDAQKRPDPRWRMMKLLLGGEMGSFGEGPGLGDEAPELDLPLVAHKETGGLELTDRMIRLADSRGTKPVVLIFGSFT